MRADREDPICKDRGVLTTVESQALRCVHLSRAPTACNTAKRRVRKLGDLHLANGRRSPWGGLH